MIPSIDKTNKEYSQQEEQWLQLYNKKINTARKAWEQNIETSNPQLVKSTKIMLNMQAYSILRNDTTLKGVICLLRAMKDQPEFEECVLKTVTSILAFTTDPLAYKNAGLAALQVLKTMHEEKLLNPNKLSSHLLHQILSACLQETRKYVELAEFILSLSPDDQLIDHIDDTTGLTLLQHFGFQSNHFAIEFLIAKSANPNLHSSKTDPVLLVAAKARAVNVLLLLEKAPNLDWNITNQYGHTAHYYLMGHSSDLPASIQKALSLNQKGLPEEIKYYLNQSASSDIPQSKLRKHLQTFISAWKACKIPIATLSQSTLVFLDNFKAYLKDKDVELFIPFLPKIKNVVGRGQIALSLCIPLLLYRNHHLMEVLKIIKDFHPSTIPDKLAIDLIEQSLNSPWDKGNVAKVLIQKKPSLLNQTCTELQFLIRQLVNSNDHKTLKNLCMLGLDLSKHQVCMTQARSIPMVQLFLKNGANINTQDADGNTLLHAIVQRGDVKLLTSLFSTQLKIRADILNKARMTPYQLAQRHRKFAVKKLLIEKYGPNLFDYPSQHLLINLFGVTNQTLFQQLVKEEIKRTAHAKNGEIFDEGFLLTLSNIYLDFWKNTCKQMNTFEKLYAAFPYKGSYNDFIPAQKAVWDLMQKDSRMKDFPIDQIWRYAIDFNAEKNGPCAFEDEPGYLNSFLKGLAYAFKTADQSKTSAWYINLHKETICLTCLIKNIDEQWVTTRDTALEIRKGIRRSWRRFSIQNMDRDPIGIQYLKTMKGTWTFRDDTMILHFPDPKGDELDKALENIMKQYDTYYKKAKNRAQKLMLSIWTARELEINHFFEDANGRASHLALISMVAGEKDLPAFLLPDANALDGNGPESLAYRFLEGCLNFRRVPVNYQRSAQVKKLDSLNLEGHPDLVALRKELKPLVVGKGWLDVLAAIG